MAKIKILACDKASELEQMANDFIKDKKLIDIKFAPRVYHTQYSTYGPLNNIFNDRILIIYEEE